MSRSATHRDVGSTHRVGNTIGAVRGPWPEEELPHLLG